MSHIVRWFAYSDQPTRKARAHDALINMGASVFSGITLTKFFGISVLAFSKSQIFEVSYTVAFLSVIKVVLIICNFRFSISGCTLVLY